MVTTQDPRECKFNDDIGGCLCPNNDFVSCRLANALFPKFNYCHYFNPKTDKIVGWATKDFPNDDISLHTNEPHKK